MRRVTAVLNKFNDVLFCRPRAGFEAKAHAAALMVFLFLMGVLHWGIFFNGGDISFKAEDWPMEYTYFSVLKQAVTSHVLPYHISVPFHGTQRFLALPETVISPQIVLLPFLSLGRFMLVNALLCYTIGFIGCLMIRRRYQMGGAAFTVLFLLLNFNGHITAHLGVGHQWFGYFFLPWFCLFVLEWIESSKRRADDYKIALALFGMILQGSFHMFLWCLMFLLLVMAFNRRLMWPGLRIILLSLLLASFRILPAAVTFAGKGYSFQTGYPTLMDLCDALVRIRDHTYVKLGGIFGRMGWWEYDAYVGVIGLAVILYFGIYLRLRARPETAELLYRELDWPLVLMAILSMSYFYSFIANLPIPLINSERATTRFMVVPLLMVSVVACIRMQAWLPRLEQAGAAKWLAVPALMQMAFSFVNHSAPWSIARIEIGSEAFELDTSAHIITQQDDAYVAVVKISALASLMVLVWVVFALVRTWQAEKRLSRS